MAKLVTKSIEMKKGSLAWLEDRKWILPTIFSVVIFIMAIWGIGNFNQLLLYDDEFGYWTASAYLTGTDWTSVTSGIPYYSYGYGFLILTPIRLIFSNPEAMYKAAIIVNALLLVGSYWIARNVTRQLFKEAHWALVDTVCFVVMLYPSNIVFSHIAWAECLLVFVFWVFVWLSLKVINKPTIWNHIGLACVIVYLYVVHQRTLAVIIATVMIMIYRFVIDKSVRKQVIIFGVVALGLMFIHGLIKEDILLTFYNNNSKVAVNNLEGQMGKMQMVFMGDGFFKLIFSMMGKWFYLVVASGMMFWWSAEIFLKSSFGLIVKTVSKKQADSGKRVQEKKNGKIELDLIWSTWMALAFIGNFLICAIYMIDIGRNDMLLYGRYNEYMIGMYIIVGIFCFLNDDKWLWKTVVYIMVGVCIGWGCQVILNQINVTSYQLYHSVCTSPFLKGGNSPRDAVLAYALGGIGFGGLVMLLMKSAKWKKIDWLRVCIIVVIPFVIFSKVSLTNVLGRMTDKQVLRVTNIRTIVNWIDKLDEPSRVYYLSDTESRYWSESFQFLLGERPLEVISKSEIDSREDAYYIVGDGFVDSTGFEDEYYCIKRTNQFALVVHADGELAEEAIRLKNQ